MNSRFLVSSLLAVAFSAFLSSCFSSSKVNTKNEASVGRQLTELNMAHQQGIVTDKEYVRLKKRIIKNND